jgi:hypothetical protein
MSASLNSNQFAVNYLKEFSASQFLAGQQAQRQLFDAAAAGLFSGSTLAETLSNGLADGRITAPTSVSELKSGNIIFWEDNNNETQVGIVLPDLARALHLNPAVTDYESVSLNGLNLKGRVVVQGWIGSEVVNSPSVSVNHPVSIPYNPITTKNYPRPIRGATLQERLSGFMPTNALSGVLIFETDTDFNYTGGINAYANFYMNSVVSIWQSFLSPDGSNILLNSNPIIQNLTQVDFNNLEIDTVHFFVNDTGTSLPNLLNSNAPIPNLIMNYLTSNVTRLAQVIVGNGANSSMPISHVGRSSAITYCYMFQNDGAEVQAHEFGHICGLADRYVNVLDVPLNNNLTTGNIVVPINLTQVGQPTIGPNILLPNALLQFDVELFPNTVAISRRTSYPIIYLNEPSYDYLTNLMSVSGNTISDTQIAVIFNPDIFEFEAPPFRVNLFVMNNEVSICDGVEFVYANNNTNVVSFQGMKLWNNRAEIFDGTLPRNQRPVNIPAFINRDQWFKLLNSLNGTYDIFRPNNAFTSDTRYSKFSSSMRSGWPRVIQNVNNNQTGNYVIYCDNNQRLALSQNSGIVPNDIRNTVSYAIKWFIDNSMIQ